MCTGTFHRVKQLFRYNFLDVEQLMQNPLRMCVFSDCLSMYDSSVLIKSTLNSGVRVERKRSVCTRCFYLHTL